MLNLNVTVPGVTTHADGALQRDVVDGRGGGAAQGVGDAARSPRVTEEQTAQHAHFTGTVAEKRFMERRWCEKLRQAMPFRVMYAVADPVCWGTLRALATAYGARGCPTIPRDAAAV